MRSIVLSRNASKPGTWRDGGEMVEGAVNDELKADY